MALAAMVDLAAAAPDPRPAEHLSKLAADREMQVDHRLA
jgi:hypothetical protein